jgi:hypothetical protein
VKSSTEIRIFLMEDKREKMNGHSKFILKSKRRGKKILSPPSKRKKYRNKTPE